MPFVVFFIAIMHPVRQCALCLCSPLAVAPTDFFAKIKVQQQQIIHASNSPAIPKHGRRPLVVSLGSFCSTFELHPRWVRIIPGYGWIFLVLEIAGHVTGAA